MVSHKNHRANMVRVAQLECTLPHPKDGDYLFKPFPALSSSLWFLDLFLSTLCPTVSIYSGSVYGQLCGKARDAV